MKRFLSLIVVLLSARAFAANAPKVTYEQDVRPIFAASCVSCHNPDKNKAGLNLTTFQGAMAGSSDGKVLTPGSPDDSMLYLAVTHQQDPFMPPKTNKLPDAQLEIIRKWIEGGCLETSGSTAAIASNNASKLDMKVTVAKGKPAGPPPMPKDLPIDPIEQSEHPAAPGAIAASPWAPLIAMAVPHQILLYQAQTHDLIGVLPFPLGLAKTLAFSRNGSVLIAGGGIGGQSGKVELYDVVTGRTIGEVGEEYDEVLAADISPDQSNIALGGPGKILKIYSTSGGPALHKLTQHTDWVTAVAYSPDGVLLASGDRNGGLRVWEAGTANEFYTLNGHKASITHVCFRADSNVLASSSEDGTVKLWDMNTGKQIKSINAHPGGVLSVDFAPDGKLVTCGRDHAVRVWGPNGNKLLDLPRMRDIAVHAIFADQGSLIVADDLLGDVKLASAKDGKLAGELEVNPPTIAQHIVEVTKRLEVAEALATRARAQLIAPQKELDKANAELHSAQMAAADAKKSLADAQAKYATAQASATSAEKAQATAEKDLAAKQAQRDQLAQSLAMVMKDPAPQLTDVIAVNNEKVSPTTAPTTAPVAPQAVDVKVVSNKAQQAKDALASAETTLTTAKRDLDTRRAECAKANSEVASAKAAVDKANADLTAAVALVQSRQANQKTVAQALAKVKASSDSVFHQLAIAQAESVKWHDTQLRSKLFSARQQLADLTARQQQVTQAIQQIISANQILRDGPQKVQQAEARLAAANKANDDATRLQQQTQATLAQHETLVKQSGDLVKSLEAAKAKDSTNKSIVESATKATESFNALNNELPALRASATTAAANAQKTAAELSAATSALDAARSALANAPKVLDQAQKTATTTLNTDLARAKARVDELTAQQPPAK
jgi:hypothetical protein